MFCYQPRVLLSVCQPWCSAISLPALVFYYQPRVLLSVSQPWCSAISLPALVFCYQPRVLLLVCQPWCSAISLPALVFCYQSASHGVLLSVCQPLFCDQCNNNNNNRIYRRNLRCFTISSLRRKPSPTRTLKWPGQHPMQIKCNTLSAYHMQHVVIRATWYEGTAQLLSLTELKSHLFELYLNWLKPLTDEGGEETGVPEENLRRWASENATY